MKKTAVILLIAFTCASFAACKVGKGCPSNGKNIGAEKLLSGDKAAEKAARKAPKFKS